MTVTPSDDDGYSRAQTTGNACACSFNAMRAHKHYDGRAASNINARLLLFACLMIRRWRADIYVMENSVANSTP